MTCKGHRERLYQRFQNAGLQAFAEHEKLELLLTLVIPRKDCKPLAKTILKQYDNLFDFFYSDPADWKKIPGLGIKSCLFFSIIKSFLGEIVKSSLVQKKSFQNPKQVAKYLMLSNKESRRESFKILLLNVRYELIAEETISRGTIDEAPVYIRHIIESVITHNAKAIIISHNHPSGNTQASTADITVTNKIKKALNLINVDLLDHIIIGKGSFSSLSENHHL